MVIQLHNYGNQVNAELTSEWEEDDSVLVLRPQLLQTFNHTYSSILRRDSSLSWQTWEKLSRHVFQYKTPHFEPVILTANGSTCPLWLFTSSPLINFDRLTVTSLLFSVVEWSKELSSFIKDEGRTGQWNLRIIFFRLHSFGTFRHPRTTLRPLSEVLYFQV